jgi:sigma-E factor negative regulatory protein RseB
MLRRIAFLLISLAAGAAQALEAGVEQWLVRMDHAMASISYRGTLVSTGPQRIDTLRVLHRVDEQGRVRERIYALDGPRREVLRDGDRVRCLISGQSSLIVDNPIPTRLLARIPLADILGSSPVYRVELGATDRVAARDAQIIEIRPLDRYRYGRTLWLDADTGMLLRSLVFDPEGAVVEKLSFVDIEIGAMIGDAELQSDLDNASDFARYHLPAQGGETALGGFRPEWVPDKLPRGFRLASVGSGSPANPFEHLLFSDGLSSFSIYLEPGDQAVLAEHVEARGATHIYTGRVEDRVVTVVGEVPASTVQLVGHHFLLLQHPALRHLE